MPSPSTSRVTLSGSGDEGTLRLQGHGGLRLPHGVRASSDERRDRARSPGREGLLAAGRDRLRRHDDRSCDLRLDVAEAALEPRAAARRLLVRSDTDHAEHSDPRALRGHLEHCLGARVSEVLQPRGDADVPRAGVRRDAFPLPWRRVYVSANRNFKRLFPSLDPQLSAADARTVRPTPALRRAERIVSVHSS